LPGEAWERCRALAGIERPASATFAALQLPPPLLARLERNARSSRQSLRAASTAPRLAVFAIREAAAFATELATAAWELMNKQAPPRDSLRNRARLARRAETWMRERLAAPVQVPDVCHALRVSRRELEYAFRTVFEQSPRDFLHALRLNAVHRALRSAEGTVLQVALDHGIMHPGRFAAHYRAIFGESPSETKRRFDVL
jgi:transcriptional regulator GlxA family with amidase domain